MFRKGLGACFFVPNALLYHLYLKECFSFSGIFKAGVRLVVVLFGQFYLKRIEYVCVLISTVDSFAQPLLRLSAIIYRKREKYFSVGS